MGSWIGNGFLSLYPPGAPETDASRPIPGSNFSRGRIHSYGSHPISKKRLFWGPVPRVFVRKKSETSPGVLDGKTCLTIRNIVRISEGLTKKQKKIRQGALSGWYMQFLCR